MTVITISTVGYGELHPLSAAARLFTVMLIVVGVGTVAVAISIMFEGIFQRQMKLFMEKRNMQKEVDRLTEHIIVCGYGRMGRNIANALTSTGRTVVIIEMDPQAVEEIEREGRLVFGGGSVCFPNRWDLRSKLGLTLREVHAPVPRLNEQLGEPVERILARLTPERSYWRLGWGIIDVAEGYTPTDGTGPSRPALPSTDTLHVRVERETLRRFPRTGCVLFTIRTYVARLDDVAADGVHRNRLAAAVDLMPGDVREYKDLATFGEELVRSLRSNDGFAPEVDTL